LFPQIGEVIPPTGKPPVEKEEHFANFLPGKNSFLQNFLVSDRVFCANRKIKSLIEKILRYLPVFSAIIQFLPSLSRHSQEADATRPYGHFH